MRTLMTAEEKRPVESEKNPSGGHCSLGISNKF